MNQTYEEVAKEYLASIIKPLTIHPEKVEIKHHIDTLSRAIVLNVIADDNDLPLLIGKRGLMARCIRNVLRGWCGINNCRLILHIGEPIKFHEETD